MIINLEPKPMLLEGLISQLTELLKRHGNREVEVEINIEVNDDFDSYDWHTLGFPKNAYFGAKDGKVKITLQNDFEV